MHDRQSPERMLWARCRCRLPALWRDREAGPRQAGRGRQPDCKTTKKQGLAKGAPICRRRSAVLCTIVVLCVDRLAAEEAELTADKNIKV